MVPTNLVATGPFLLDSMPPVTAIVELGWVDRTYLCAKDDRLTPRSSTGPSVSAVAKMLMVR